MSGQLEFKLVTIGENFKSAIKKPNMILKNTTSHKFRHLNKMFLTLIDGEIRRCLRSIG